MYRQKKRCRALWISITLVMIFTSILFQPVNAQTQVYEKVDPSEIVSGQYVMVASNGYAPTPNISGDPGKEWVPSIDLEVGTSMPDILQNSSLEDIIWTLVVSETNGGKTEVSLAYNDGRFIAPRGGDENGIKEGNYSWLFVDNQDGTVSFEGQGDDTVIFACNQSWQHRFRAYRKDTVNGDPQVFPSTFTLYRLQEEPAGAYRRIQGYELVSGTYIMVLDNGYAPTIYNSSWVYSNNLEIVPSETPYLTPDDGLSVSIWTIEVLNSGKVRLKDSKGLYVAPKAGKNNELVQGQFEWTVNIKDNSTFVFSAPDMETSVTLAANMTSNQEYTGRFRAYQDTTINNSPDIYPVAFNLYQVSDTMPLAPIPEVYIYEAYGGGGLAESVWKNDYVILINKEDQAVSLDGWYLYYASSGGKFSQTNESARTALSGNIEAGGYYVIQQHSAGSGDGKDLPDYDTVGNIDIASKQFKLALTNDSNSPLLPDDSNIVDFLGVGNANQYLGTGPAPTLSNTQSLQRIYYQGNNKTDYEKIDADGENLDYLSPAIPELLELEFTSVPSEPWTKGGSNLVFKLNADFDDFVSVTVNGSLLDQSNYSVDSGSTILSLFANYLENLEPDTYSLMVTFSAGEAVAGGEVETEFEIAAPSEPPGTTPTGPGQTEPTPPSETEPTAPETSQPIPTEPTTPTVPLPTEPGGEDPQPPQTVAPETEVVPTGESIHWMLYGIFFILVASLVFLVSQKTLRKADKTR